MPRVLPGRRFGTAARSSQTASSSLPSYVSADARIRLSSLALIYALAYLTAGFLIPKPDIWLESGVTWLFNLIGITTIAVALGVALALRMGWVSDVYLTSLAFGFEILGAVGIDVGIAFWNGDPVWLQIGGVSWTGVWILAFAILFPASPFKTFAVAMVAASVRPLFMWIALLRGAAVPELALMLQFIIPTYICAGIAVAAARIVYGLGRQVHAARQMGSYHLIEKLGEGGMGEVWTARHRFLARPAAIKLVRSRNENGDSVQTKRFEREVQATAQLESPHTIHVYDYGISDDGIFYYVMELLDGLDLHQLIRDYGPMPAPRVIHILRQACHSLGEAHERGLVHRDIKPANMFLCRSGRDFDVVKLLDFGLVKATLSRADDQLLTQAGSFYGTPAYASPEMARGEPDAVDSKSDIYSLGCVAFWLLTARPVFEAEHAMGILVKHTTKMPDPPSRHAKGAVPAELDRLVLQCLAKEKGDRPASVDAISDDLEAMQRSYPWPSSMAREWWNAQSPITSTVGVAAHSGSHPDQERTLAKRFAADVD